MPYRPVNIWTFTLKTSEFLYHAILLMRVNSGIYFIFFSLTILERLFAFIVCIAPLNLNKCDWLGLELLFVSSSSSLVNSESWAAGRLPS